MVAPIIRIVTSRISLSATYMTGTQGIVIVIRDKEELIVLRAVGIEIDVEIIGIVPMVIPHSQCYIHSIGLEQKFHIAYPLYPLIEVLVIELADIQNEVLQLRSSLFKRSFILFQLIREVFVIAVRAYLSRIDIPEVRSIDTFPEITLIAAELGNSAFNIMVIDSFQHIVDTEISRLRISLDMHPYPAIDILKSCPDTCTSEKIIAEKFPYMRRIFLEPLQV
jgi:hypothetical protein